MKRTDWTNKQIKPPKKKWHSFEEGQRFMWVGDSRDRRVTVLTFNHRGWRLMWEDIPDGEGIGIVPSHSQDLDEFRSWWKPV